MLNLTPFNLQSTQPLIIGVSGGADSLCLLALLHETGQPLIATHFDHRLRPESAGEAEHVRAIAAQMGVPFVTGAEDVGAFAQQNGLSIEEAARKLRYRFLFAAARAHHAQAVAVAHTADDQVETVVMHLVRGAGLAGLKGMAAETLLPEFDAEIPLIRPILHLWRYETEAACRQNGLDFVTDPTNADTTYFRNRLRHELLPQFASYNPQFKQAIVRSAQSLQDDHDSLTAIVNELWDETLAETGNGYLAFDLDPLKRLTRGLRRNLLRGAIFRLRPNLRSVDFELLNRAADAVHLEGSQRLDLSAGLSVFCENNLLYIAEFSADLPFTGYIQLENEFSLENGSFDVGNGWQLTVSSVESDNLLETALVNDDPLTAWLDADLTVGRLRVRKLRPGDRFEPLNMPRQRIKLTDLFINLKIPRRMRANYPLVCVDDEIAWVTGLRLAHPFRVTDATKRAVVLRVTQF